MDYIYSPTLVGRYQRANGSWFEFTDDPDKGTGGHAGGAGGVREPRNPKPSGGSPGVAQTLSEALA